MRPAIKVENISKQYQIGLAQQRQDTLRDAIAHGLSHLQPGRRKGGDDVNKIWALKDVSFEVQSGEVLGVIGRNGAGKSTLLKILSRITEPTRGRAILNGRVGSLLEVGTGFHPELTGRENIYLNGAILGMRKQEIERKFDEIVAFSEIEKFLDTPVKRYSSGMYVRLAFAVAAHLEPEILLVDEVLAVGDAEFQKKCLGKIGAISREGRTVIFVSHSIPMILRLCERVILINEGKIEMDGLSNEVTGRYIGSGSTNPAEKVWHSIEDAPGNSDVKLKAVRVMDEGKTVCDNFDITSAIYLQIEYWNRRGRDKLVAIIHLINEEGIVLFASNDWNNSEWWNHPRRKGIIKATCRIPPNYLAEGRFFILAAIGNYNPDINHISERDVVSFRIIDRSKGDGARGVYAGGNWPGVIRPMLKWEIETSNFEEDEFIEEKFPFE